MYKLKLLFLRIIRKIGIFQKINFSFSKKINETGIIIPFINGIGMNNFIHKPNWLDVLIKNFVKSDNGAFVDVGVNIGQTLLRVKTSLPDISYIGFEPNATCTFYTQQLIRKNNFKNCLLYNCALSSSVQKIILEKTLGDDKRASIISALRPNSFTDSESILAVDFDSLSFKENISFVKIDVEGAELEVLTGMKQMIQKKQPIITCEVLDSHNKEQLDFTQKRADNLAQLLSSLDYAIIQLHTSEQKIQSFNKLDGFDIVLWTPASYALNDYLFYPRNKEKAVIKTLTEITK